MSQKEGKCVELLAFFAWQYRKNQLWEKHSTEVVFGFGERLVREMELVELRSFRFEHCAFTTALSTDSIFLVSQKKLGINQCLWTKAETKTAPFFIQENLPN